MQTQLNGCLESLKMEISRWVGARKRFKDERSEHLAPELCKMWKKVYEIEQQNKLDWQANDAGPAGKFGALLKELDAALPRAIERLLQ